MNKFVLAAFAAIAFLLPIAAPAATGDYDYYDRFIWVQNDTDDVLYEVQSAFRDETVFDGIDILEEVIYPGDGAYVSVEDNSGYCQYWLHAKFDDGTTVTSKHTLNACHYGLDNAPTWRIWE
jgi:hypothetical protein